MRQPGVMLYGDADGTYTQKERNKQWIVVLLDLRTNINLITKEKLRSPAGN
jgi:hypothetical protein